MNKGIFMATPISGFESKEEYIEYRMDVLRLISYLRENGYKVCSEVENVKTADDYDSPAKSVENDFNNIDSNDYFLLLHPAKMQTSSLIEFGYACARKKKIVAIGKIENFPYLVIGYIEFNRQARIIDVDKISRIDFAHIVDVLNSI